MGAICVAHRACLKAVQPISSHDWLCYEGWPLTGATLTLTAPIDRRRVSNSLKKQHFSDEFKDIVIGNNHPSNLLLSAVSPKWTDKHTTQPDELIPIIDSDSMKNVSTTIVSRALLSKLFFV